VVRGLFLWGGPPDPITEREAPGVITPAGRGRMAVVGSVVVPSVGGRFVRVTCRSVLVSGSVGGGLGSVCEGTGSLVRGDLRSVLSAGVRSVAASPGGFCRVVGLGIGEGSWSVGCGSWSRGVTVSGWSVRSGIGASGVVVSGPWSVLSRGCSAGAACMALREEPTGIRWIRIPTPIRSSMTVESTSSSTLKLLTALRTATNHALWWSILTGRRRLVLIPATIPS